MAELSLGGDALEAVDVVLARIHGVRLVVKVALAHVRKHLACSGVLHRQSHAAEVCIEEVREGGHRLLLLDVADRLEGVWGHEENWRSDRELSHFGVSKHTDRHHVATLEGVTGDEFGVSVV